MIVARLTQPVKFGKVEEYIELCQQFMSWYADRNIPIRCYTAYYAQYDVVVWETEYESLAAAEKFDKEFWADPFVQPFIQKMPELVERGRSIETWILRKV